LDDHEIATCRPGRRGARRWSPTPTTWSVATRTWWGTSPAWGPTSP